MRIFYSAAFIGLFGLVASLSSCQQDDSPLPLNSVQGIVLGESCNGTLIRLPNGPNVGRSINYINQEYTNVFGTYSTLPNTSMQPGQTITFRLRKPTEEESVSRPCLAIYGSYDVPQLVIEPPR